MLSSKTLLILLKTFLFAFPSKSGPQDGKQQGIKTAFQVYI